MSRVTGVIALCVAASAVLLSGCSVQGTAEGAVTPNNGSSSTHDNGLVDNPASSTAPTSTVSSAPADGANTASGSGGDGSGGASEANGQCLTGSLTVTAGSGDAGAGHSFIPVVFTNSGAEPCTIAAYPGVSFVTGDDGRQVGDPATRVSASTPAVTLQPGQAASASLSITNPGVYDPAQCKPVAVRGLRVYPPNNTAAAFVPLSGNVQGCSAHVPNQEPLKVKPVVPGRDG
jgi:Domain of unknown function (DUF4232)